MQQRTFDFQQWALAQEPRLSQLLAQPVPTVRNDQNLLLNISQSNVGAQQWTQHLSQSYPFQVNLNTSQADLSQAGRLSVQFPQTLSGQPENSLQALKPEDRLIGLQNYAQQPHLYVQNLQTLPNSNELRKAFQGNEHA